MWGWRVGAGFPCLEQEVVTGAVPHTSSAAGMVQADREARNLGDACLQPSCAQASGPKGWPRNFYRVAWKAQAPGRLPLQHRPGPPPTRYRREAAVLGRRSPPRGFWPPRRPHSPAPRRRHHHAMMVRSVLLGEVTLSCMPRSFAPVMPPDQVSEREVRTWFVPVCQVLLRSP